VSTLVCIKRSDAVLQVLDHYKRECDLQVAALRSGLSQIIPINMLVLLRWDELERLTCGNTTFDVALLRAITEYSGLTQESQRVRWFWKVVEKMAQHQRSRLLRFATGYSRLPSSASDSHFKLEIRRWARTDALPKAHTCSFQIELPAFSSFDKADWCINQAVDMTLP